jgi:hypothetical protein
MPSVRPGSSTRAVPWSRTRVVASGELGLRTAPATPDDQLGRLHGELQLPEVLVHREETELGQAKQPRTTRGPTGPPVLLDLRHPQDTVRPRSVRGPYVAAAIVLPPTFTAKTR